MPELQPLLLAVVLGTGFGVFMHYMGETWQRLAAFMFVLWAFQTAGQQVWRIYEFGESTYQLTYVSTLRFVFAACACGILWALNRRALS